MLRFPLLRLRARLPLSLGSSPLIIDVVRPHLVIVSKAKQSHIIDVVRPFRVVHPLHEAEASHYRVVMKPARLRHSRIYVRFFANLFLEFGLREVVGSLLPSEQQAANGSEPGFGTN